MIGGKSGGAGEINAASGPGSVPDAAPSNTTSGTTQQSLADLRAEFEAAVLAACAQRLVAGAAPTSLHLGAPRV